VKENPELLLLKKQKALLLQQKLDVVRSFGLLSYRPHFKQDRFHRAGKKRRRLVRAGNRFGKSQLGCAEDCAWLLNERPWYSKDDPARTEGIPQHPVKGVVITTDFDIVNQVWTNERGSRDTYGKLWKLLPPDFVKNKSRNHQGVIDFIHCENGSSLKFETVKSWMNDPQSVESVDYDFIHVDEPCPEKMFAAMARGLMDRQGSAWFTLTPLREVWINDYFFPRAKGMRRSENEESVEGDRWAITGTTYDNPYLSPEAIKEFEETLSREEQECRIKGIPIAFSGLIYKDFDYDKHVLKEVPHGWESFTQPPKDYTVYVYIDPHPKTPHAVLFLAISPLGQMFVFNEIFEHTTISQLSDLIHARVGSNYVGWIKVDPIAYINDPITGTNIADEFHKHGVLVEKATKDLSTGILRVKEKFQKTPADIFISPYLTEFLWEIERYMWDEKREKPVDEHDHMMENLYRAVLDDPRWIDAKMPNNPVPDLEMSDANLDLDIFND